MKPLYTEEEFNQAKSNDKLKCECYHCKKPFDTLKYRIQTVLKGNTTNTKLKFCNLDCKKNSMIKDRVELICQECNKTFYRKISENKSKSVFCSKICYNKVNNDVETSCKNCNKSIIKKPSQIKKSLNVFCNQSCSASYNNKHKTTGNRRSKLEIWLEEQLTTLYPNLQIDYNKSSAIGSELDIYIPSLNLAFELNGIFHYEPIYGVNKLNQIKENDISKSKACFDAKIDLCVIDTSGQKYVKPSTSQKYLDIINNIIKER